MNKKLIEKFSSTSIETEEREREISNGENAGTIYKYVVAKIPCERNFIEITFPRSIDEDLILGSNIEKFKFIKDYEAIWSPSEKIIECELSSVSRRIGPSSSFLRRLDKLFNIEEEKRGEARRYDFEESEKGLKVSIGTPSDEYALLSYGKERRPRFEYHKRRPTLRIENINLKRHDEAKKILEKIGNSLLFKLDLSINLGYQLAQDRDIRRGFYRRYNEESTLDTQFPNYEYDKEPISLYWYARSAFDMPLLQFLAFYQILEFYFPIFSQKEAHNKIKNTIKDPRFNPNKDSDISKILSIISINKKQRGFGSEVEQLKATLKECLDNSEIKNFIEAEEDRISFFGDKKTRGLSKKKLSLKNPTADLVTELAERIYEIRCRIVHTKAAEENFELLLPSSPELKFINYDTSIIEFAATKVLVSTSRVMKI